MPIISLSLPKALLEQMDALIIKYGYTGRSEFVRSALRDYMAVKFPQESLGGVTHGVVVALTDHEARPSVDKKVIDVIHEHQVMIKSFHHQLLSGGWCLNIAIIEAGWAEVRGLLKALRKVKGVDALHYIPLRLGGGGST